MRAPTASTGLIVLLGEAVGYSLSPTIHNAAFAHDGLDVVYLACSVETARFEEAVDGLWALGAHGANVTIPYKERALSHAGGATPTAQALGAANTLIRSEAGWLADNTDVAGFLGPLDPYRDTLGGASVVVFGAGGAARAVVYAALTSLGAARVTLVARRPTQAEGLAADLEAVAQGADVCVETPASAAESVRRAALVVNATPLGMGDGQTPWPDADAFHPGQIVYDLVYRPAQTPLMAAAATRGAIPIGGLPMLLGQAGDAYRQWTGRDFPLAVARAAAQSHLDP